MEQNVIELNKKGYGLSKDAKIDLKSSKYKIVFKNILFNLISTSKPFNKIVFLCIGTDRSTGDSYGPLVGNMIKDLTKKYEDIAVWGTLDYPVHANNLKTVIDIVAREGTLVIAIDSMLGSLESVGSILLRDKPLKPGSAMDKKLPVVGDISICGVVNVSGTMEFMTLQNTRLGVVYNLAKDTATCIKAVVREYEKFKEKIDKVCM